MPSRSRALAVSDPRRLTGSLLGPHGGARTLIPAMRRIVRLCSLVLNTNLRSRAVGARAFFCPRADLRTGWTARGRSPPTGDCGALIYGRCSMSNQMSEYPHYIERP